MPLRDNFLEYSYHLEGFYHDPSSPHTHDVSQSTNEDFDFGDFVNLEPEHQPSRMDQSNSGIDTSRSATLERGPQPSQQENTRQSPTSQPNSSAPSSPSNNGVLDDMQIDNEQKANERKGNENAGSGDVFEALSSIRRSFCDPESTRNKNTLPLIGIPTSDITTYPLNRNESRPKKRSRTGNETKHNEGIHDYVRMVLDGYCTHFSVDPSPSQKGELASVFRLRIEDVDKFFWGQRVSRKKPPTIVVQDDIHSPESSRARSKIQEQEIFSQNGQPSPSETNFSMTTTSIVNHPNHCTHHSCSRTFKSPSDWKVHEELVHWVQKRYLCLLCAIYPAADKTRYFCKACQAPFYALSTCISHVMQCHSARQLQTTPYKRYYDFKAHLQSHPVGDREVKALFESVRNNKDWYYPVESDWPRTCTYYSCSQEFQSWEERQEHYPAYHFKNKKSVSSRRSGTGISRLNLSGPPGPHPRLSQEPQDTG